MSSIRSGSAKGLPRPSIAEVPTYGLHLSFAETSTRVQTYRQRVKAGKHVDEHEMQDLRREVTMDEHIVPPDELEQRLRTSYEQGLEPERAAQRLAEDGPNRLTPPQGVPWWRAVLKHLFGGFSILLWVAAVLAFVSYGVWRELASDNLYIGVVLVVVVLITGAFSYYQEAKSLAVMKGFAEMVPTKALVLRGGHRTQVDAASLVVGDVVDLHPGDKVPADVRILLAHGLKVDNSSLTGEADPQTRVPQMTDENPMETKNIAFFSTPVVEGTGTGVVISTGDHTVIGRIAGLASNVKHKKTPIARELEHLVKIIASIAVGTGVVFFLIGLARVLVSAAAAHADPGPDIVRVIVFSIGIIVAAVPEGLLATVTVALTLTAKRMAARNVLVKNLEAVETLGSTSCICSDKTGTLTQNRMTAAHLWFDGHIYTTDTTVTRGNFEVEAESFQALHDVCALCNTATFDPADMDTPLPQRKCVGGNATEYALLKFAHQIRDIYEHRGAHPQRATIPFNSTNKWALTVHQRDDGSYFLLIKGAPERIVDRCKYALELGQRRRLTPAWLREFNRAYEELGSQGERVIGLARRDLDPARFPPGFEFNVDTLNFPTTELTFVGLISLIDPPREAVPNAVNLCLSAHIKIIMVTGDHPLTAKAIARQVGIIRDETVEDIAQREGVDPSMVARGRVRAIVVTGSEVKDMAPHELDEVIAYEQVVFARTSPQQKLVIVEAVQRAGHIVAVTGDGVNDSPALKRADIGIAMGVEGTDVSKEAADMILLDDNFASLVMGVEQGRTIFDNLKKSIAYKLTANVPEFFPFVLYSLAGLPLMLTTLLILAIDVGTDMWPAIALAYERPEADIMLRHPRDPKRDKLVGAKLVTFAYLILGILQALACLYAFLVVLGDANAPVLQPARGFPPTAVWGLADDFSPKVDVEAYRVCRVKTRPTPVQFVGCDKTPSDLDLRTNALFPGLLSAATGTPGPASESNQTQAFQASALNWQAAVERGDIVDYCYDERHQRWLEARGWDSCRRSGTLLRLNLLQAGQTAYFVAVVICQWACLYLCKTRWVSLFQQGIRNVPLVLGWVFENFLAALIIYALNKIFFTWPLAWQWFFPPVPFALVIFCYDEIRKLVMRTYPHGWVHKHTYY